MASPNFPAALVAGLAAVLVALITAVTALAVATLSARRQERREHVARLQGKWEEISELISALVVAAGFTTMSVEGGESYVEHVRMEPERTRLFLLMTLYALGVDDERVAFFSAHDALVKLAKEGRKNYPPASQWSEEDWHGWFVGMHDAISEVQKTGRNLQIALAKLARRAFPINA